MNFCMQAYTYESMNETIPGKTEYGFFDIMGRSWIL